MKRDSDQILTEWLVLQAQSGDPRAINVLARQWHPKLLCYAARQIQDLEAAKDIVQEAFITVSKSIGKLRDPASFPRWIYQILHRRGADYIRRKTRYRTNNAAAKDGRHSFAEEEMWAVNIDIQKALERLKDDSYQLVHLRYLHGFNLKEIARIKGIPVGTVKSRLHAARNLLRQSLGDKPL